jgi:hypothetical protein
MMARSLPSIDPSEVTSPEQLGTSGMPIAWYPPLLIARHRCGALGGVAL